MAGTRQYEAIVLGATGYTGKYTAEHITTSLPTDFKWALAGRSEGKLRSLAEDLKSFNIDRAQPGIEIAHLSKEDRNLTARQIHLHILRQAHGKATFNRHLALQSMQEDHGRRSVHGIDTGRSSDKVDDKAVA